MSNEYPLFLPKGSIRALMAMTLVVGSIGCVWMQIPNGEVIYTLAGVVITYYFNTRDKIADPKNG